jgi:aldehyde dehydrogenase (NAD+)
MEVLEGLGIKKENAGASVGYSWQFCQGDFLESINPTSGQSIAKIRMAETNNYEEIVKKSQVGFSRWREVPAPIRGECIRLIAQELRAKKDWLGTLISLETGKIKAEGDGEVQEMIDIADFAVGQSRMLYGKTMQSERKRHRMLEQWLPLGPVGIITAFNFPMAVWSWNAFMGAICGDTIIWKPSHKVPLCAIAVQNICNTVMQSVGYDGIFSLLITHNSSLASQMVEDHRLPLISFTGSSRIGRQTAVKVAHRLGKSILELSGNNAIIIDETANLKLAIPAVVFGAIGTAGQRCTSTRRVIVHESLYETVVDQLVTAYQQIKIGDPLSADTLMGPLIDSLAVADYQAAIQQIREMGGEILYGGQVLDRAGYFVEPTLVQAKNDWSIVQQETFGPILYLIKYKTFNEAIALQNGVRQGLSSGLFTESLKHAEYYLSALGSDCGIANINLGTSGAEIGGAFGGEKETGGGREAGSDAWKSYMRRQTNTINWSDELPLAQGITFTTQPLR